MVPLSALTLGPVALTVADLDRSAAWYRDALGLEMVAPPTAEGVLLGAGDQVLLELVEEPGAVPAAGQAGLFHAALLLPDRIELARWVRHAVESRIPLEGASDHVVSEAVYLRDPDGHGIEIYADRDRAVWEGRVQELMTTLALDAPALLDLADEAERFAGMPAGTSIGHVHLQVDDVTDAIAWYRDVLGLDLVAVYGPQAAFLSSGGYHHHIGANTWGSRVRGPAGPGTARLLRFEVGVPADELDRLVERVRDAGGDPLGADDGWAVRDPSGLELRLVASA